MDASLIVTRSMEKLSCVRTRIASLSPRANAKVGLCYNRMDQAIAETCLLIVVLPFERVDV